MLFKLTGSCHPTYNVHAASHYQEVSGIHFWLNVTTSAVDSHFCSTALDPVTFRETVSSFKVTINLTA